MENSKQFILKKLKKWFQIFEVFVDHGAVNLSTLGTKATHSIAPELIRRSFFFLYTFRLEDFKGSDFSSVTMRFTVRADFNSKIFE